MSNEKPILFSGEMVRAILDGRKTQTRRVMKPQPEYDRDDTFEPVGDFWRHSWTATSVDGVKAHASADFICPYGEPGTRLWVRETWRPYWDKGDLYCCVNYRADGAKIKPVISNENDGHRFTQMCDRSKDDEEPWRPSIHMSRWASRITLEVTDVRVQRVQETSEDDALAEGVDAWVEAFCSPDYYEDHSILDAWELLWDSINGKLPGCSWGDNPWVWAVTFKVIS